MVDLLDRHQGGIVLEHLQDETGTADPGHQAGREETTIGDQDQGVLEVMIETITIVDTTEPENIEDDDQLIKKINENVL